MLDALRNISILNNFLQNVTCSMWVTCNFLIIFTVNPKVPLTVSPRQFKIFAQMPKLSSWKV